MQQRKSFTNFAHMTFIVHYFTLLYRYTKTSLKPISNQLSKKVCCSKLLYRKSTLCIYNTLISANTSPAHIKTRTCNITPKNGKSINTSSFVLSKWVFGTVRCERVGKLESSFAVFEERGKG